MWGTVGASGLAAGVIIGGVLSTASWRWVFLINLPLALIGGLAALRLLLRNESRTSRPLNVPSAVLVTAGMLAAALGLTWAASEGWLAATTVGGIGAAVVLMTGFLLYDRRSARPLVDRGLRRTRTLVIGCAATALYMASVGNEFFVVTLLLQQDRGYGPLAAGLAFLPLAVMITVGNAVAGRIVGPLGVRRTLTLAFVIDAVGLLLLALQINGDGYVLNLLPGLLISGLGHGITYTAMFIAGTQDLHDDAPGHRGRADDHVPVPGRRARCRGAGVGAGHRTGQGGVRLGFRHHGRGGGTRWRVGLVRPAPVRRIGSTSARPG